MFYYKMINVQKQVGVKDCGLFAIANAMALVLNRDPSEMRDHLLKIFITNQVSLFPDFSTALII